MNKKYLLSILCCSIVSVIYADTAYSSTDSNGVIVITNKPVPSATPFVSSSKANQATTISNKSSKTAANSSASSSATAKSVSDINKQINQINQELSNKQVQKQQIDNALKDSQDAINKTANLIKQLKAKQNADANQLTQIQNTIPQMMASTNQARDLVSKSTMRIYSQIRLIENQKQSIFSGNDSLDSARKQEYLIQILKAQNARYAELNKKLTNLQTLSVKLQDEVTRLTQQITDASKKHDNLVQDLNSSKQKSVAMQQDIASDKSKLANLKQRQIELNQLLQKLARQESKKSTKPSTANSTAGSSTKNVDMGSADQSVEDNSPFMSRTLVQPVGGSVLVGFGQMRDTVKNNGVLLKVPDNAQILSISTGVVLFSGDLPGFGNMLVIDHGDNYASVYSGVTNQVNKGERVSPGQRIANSGNSSNQPMGGFYFELRHLGKPVNPTKLFSN